MSHPNKSKDKEIVIEPYVTGRGGVVILNGPFPLKMANKIGALCAAAPDMLTACKSALQLYTLSLEEMGPCDHNVGICYCGIRRESEYLAEVIKKAEGE